MAAVEACLASGVVPAALDYLDNDAADIAGAAFRGELPRSSIVVIRDADGSQAEPSAGRGAMVEALSDGAVEVLAPTDRSEIDALWRRRDRIAHAADAALGGKVSEAIAVPIGRLANAIEATKSIGHRRGPATCSWGHAGDGNLDATFLFARDDGDARVPAAATADDLFALAAELGQTVSSDHGVGLVKAGQVWRQRQPAATDLPDGVKSLLDPPGVPERGKKGSR